MGPSETTASNRFFARFAAFVAVTFGIFALAGWLLDLDQLTNVAPHWPRMPMLTAATFLLGGIALWLTVVDALRPALVAAGLVALIGLVLLFRDATGWNP